MKFKINEKMIVAVAAVVFFAAFAAIIYFDQPHGEVGAGYGSNEVVFDIEKGKETVKLATLRKVLKVLNIKVRLLSPLMKNDQINDYEEG